MTERAREALVRALGVARVDTRPETLRAYGQATFATRQRISMVLRPRSVSAVRACLRIASREGLALYPVSRGNNWGYGCRVPVRSGAAILDLGDLAGIGPLDEELGTVEVGPGVTFGKLAAFLEERGSQWMAPTSGTALDSSVLANALERGIGIGLSGSRVAHTCALEVLTATGEVVRTGLKAFAGSPAAGHYAHGLGPSLDGLFFQSNLGVVTRATVLLERRPRFFGTLQLELRPRHFPGAISALREAMEQGLIRGTLKISSPHLQLLTSYRQWGATLPEGTTLPRLVRRLSLPWRIQVPVFALRRAEAVERLGWLRSRLRGSVERLTVQPIRKVGAKPIDAHLGRPSSDGLWVSYWRHALPLPPTPDPRRDRRGVLFCSPVLPFRAQDTLKATRLFERICLGHGYEPAINLNAVDCRAILMVGAIYFGREEAGADARALACHRACTTALADAGYLPYRLGIQSMPRVMARQAPGTARTLRKIRQALDPAGILSPGRYEARRPR